MTEINGISNVILFAIEFRRAYIYFTLLAAHILYGVYGRGIPQRPSNFFSSRIICGGQTGASHNDEGFRHRHSGESFSTLTGVVTERLFATNIALKNIIHFYKEERVRFTYRDIQCIKSFAETTFGAKHDQFDVGESIYHDYQEVLNYLSVLELIKGNEDEVKPLSDLEFVQNVLFDVLCSMNKALRSLGYSGNQVSRKVQIRQTKDMCYPNSSLDRYARNLELFQFLEIFSRQMFDRFYNRDHEVF